jgi:hypothetical protein
VDVVARGGLNVLFGATPEATVGKFDSVKIAFPDRSVCPVVMFGMVFSFLKFAHGLVDFHRGTTDGLVGVRCSVNDKRCVVLPPGVLDGGLP